MDKSRAFFVVGHQNWGKSRTLRALTGGVHQVRKVTIGKQTFFIWRMSNDDDPTAWFRNIKRLHERVQHRIIATVCPTDEALNALGKLRLQYDLLFWVMRHSNSDSRVITIAEEKAMRSLGVVEIFEDKAEDTIRATKFEQFVRVHS